MLNANEKTANDFVRVRAELRDLCFDAEIEGECLISVIKRNERSLLRSKYLFHIPKGGPTELEVRHKIRQLRRLTDYLKTYGFELKHNQGLWIPAVADQEEGDTQLNVMVSENWVTKNVTAAAISDDLSSATAPTSGRYSIVPLRASQSSVFVAGRAIPIGWPSETRMAQGGQVD